MEIGPRFVDDFNGDNAALLDSIHALLRLHADGALSSPIPGLARQLLNNAAARLAPLSAAPAGPESLSVPQDAKSNPSNGLVERVARIIDPDAYDALCGKLSLVWAENALSKAREIHALYQQEGVPSSQRGDWQPIETAPRDGTRVLVYFTGAGPIVAYYDQARPDEWMRYLGFGKSAFWPPVHEDYATHWKPLDSPPAAPSTPIGGLSLGDEGDQGASRANSGGTAQAPKSDSAEGH